MDKREPPYVVRAREIDEACRESIKQGNMGYFSGYDEEVLKSSFTCALTFGLIDQDMLSKTVLSLLDFKSEDWFLAMRDFPLHATLLLSKARLQFPQSDPWCVVNIWNFCNYTTDIMKKLTGQVVTFKELCWDDKGNLVLLADMDFLSPHDHTLQDLCDMVKVFASDWLVEPQPGKDYLHCVIARNKVRDPARLTKFFNRDLVELKRRVNEQPLCLHISDRPYVGQVYPLLAN